MRTIDVSAVEQAVMDKCLELGITLESGVLAKMEKAKEEETNEATRFALRIMCDNARIAQSTGTPLCQDTGMVVVFASVGQEVTLEGGWITDAVNNGVRRAYDKGYFRKSVTDPLTRLNTRDNTPAVIHYDIVKGDKIKLEIMLKGFGSENMTRLNMLTPAAGVDGVKNVVVESVRNAGSNPCPPVVVGVGIGGTAEKAGLMSKHALLREVDTLNEDLSLRPLEQELNDSINDLGIGAQGFGGKLTSLGVHIEKYPTHIAGLPVAVSVQCHAVRHGEVTL